MEFSAVLATISGVLAAGQAIPYVKSTIQGRTKPSRVACGIGVFCNILLVGSLLTNGFSSGLILPSVFLVTGLVTLILAFKYGISAVTRTDIVAGGVAAVAIAGWLIAGPNAAVIGTNVAQVTALVATFNKLRRNPGTEDVLSWSIGGMAALLSLSAVVLAGLGGAGLTVYSLVLPVRCVLSCITILTLAYFQHRRANPAVSKHFAFAKTHHHFGLAA